MKKLLIMLLSLTLTLSIVACDSKKTSNDDDNSTNDDKPVETSANKDGLNENFSNSTVVSNEYVDIKYLGIEEE